MFSVGQCIIISLAGTIYLAGAAFLLMGPSFVPTSVIEEGKGPSAVVKEFPYFYPVVEENLDREVLTGASLPGGEVQSRVSWSGPRCDHQAIGYKHEAVDAGLLKEPICLN